MTDNASPVTDPPLRLLVAFQQAYPDQPMTWIFRAPGRDMWLAATQASSDLFTIVAADMEGRATFTLQSAKTKRTHQQRPLPLWARYPAGITLQLAQDGLDVMGLNMVVLGGETPGPRYDYAMGIVFAALWHEIYGRPFTTDTLIEIVDRTRREYVDA